MKKLEVKRKIEKYLKLIKEKNDVSAYRNLGFLYNYGDGVEQDYVKARELYEKAIEYGNNAIAYRRLGNLYSKGKGCYKNTAKAIELYQKAFGIDDFDV